MVKTRDCRLRQLMLRIIYIYAQEVVVAIIVISRFLQDRAKYTQTRLERHEGTEYCVSL
jgi:hypothetical protein